MSKVEPSSFFSQYRQQLSDEEKQRRTDNFAAEALYDQLFPAQQAVVDDPFRSKALLTPRRCGKTYCALTYAVIVCLNNPHANVTIVTLTLKSAKKLYWDQLLKFDQAYNLNCHFIHTEGICRFPNGSRIDLIGAQKRAEIEKLRGGSYDLVLIDEAASFGAAVLSELITDIIEPALSDRRGTILMTGTPGSVLQGPFYEATCPSYKDEENHFLSKPYPMPETLTEATGDPGAYWWLEKKRQVPPLWHRHSFTQNDNTACPWLWEEALMKKRARRWKDDDPTWLREYRGQWIPMGDSMVYALNKTINEDGVDECRALYRKGKGQGYNKWGLPSKETWHYVLGIDMGFEDDTAIVVVAYSETWDTFFLVYEFKEKHMLPSQIGRKLEAIQKEFDNRIEVMIADTANMAKAIVEDLNDRFNVNLIPAEKGNKNDYIELLNSDIYEGKVKIWLNSELAFEWQNLQWDLRDNDKRTLVRYGKLKENRNQDNHLSDAMLYTWRYCNHHFHRVAPEEPEPDSMAWFDRWDRDQANEATERRDEKRLFAEWTDEIDDSWIL